MSFIFFKKSKIFKILPCREREWEKESERVRGREIFEILTITNYHLPITF